MGSTTPLMLCADSRFIIISKTEFFMVSLSRRYHDLVSLASSGILLSGFLFFFLDGSDENFDNA